MPLFKNSGTRLEKALIGGWEISGIATFESGKPISIGNGVDNLGLRWRHGQPGKCHLADHLCEDPVPVVQHHVVRAACEPSSGAPRRVTMWSAPDATIGTSRCIRRSGSPSGRSLQFRAETFNTFNHTQFTNPNATLTSGNFGQITGTYQPRIWQFGMKFGF